MANSYKEQVRHLQQNLAAANITIEHLRDDLAVLKERQVHMDAMAAEMQTVSGEREEFCAALMAVANEYAAYKEEAVQSQSALEELIGRKEVGSSIRA